MPCRNWVCVRNEFRAMKSSQSESGEILPGDLLIFPNYRYAVADTARRKVGDAIGWITLDPNDFVIVLDVMYEIGQWRLLTKHGPAFMFEIQRLTDVVRVCAGEKQ